MIVIGTDEAGYGPNLGPLVVSATMWSLPEEEMFRAFSTALASERFSIDDSKKLFHGRNSLAKLERIVLSVLRRLGIPPKEFVENSSFSSLSGPDGFPIDLPVAEQPSEIVAAEKSLAAVLSRCDMEILAVRCRTIFPGEFNRLLARHDSKGSLLSEATLQLVTDLLAVEKSKQSVLVLCDKHGGRNRYLDLLTNHVTNHCPDEFFRIVTEGREKSVYRNMDSRRPLEFRFMAKGDSETPVALASMFSKYVRELAMVRLNEFWRREIPDLEPTAGYPEDAKRFKKEIEAVQRKLEIDDDTVWRRR